MMNMSAVMLPSAPSAVPSRASNSLMLAALLLLIFLLAVFQTYPMMYPGYDIWWHLDVINAVDHFSGHAYGRWHWVWNRALSLLNISDIFSRALVIHRVQFALSGALVYFSAWLVLESAFVRQALNPWLVPAGSFFSMLTWFVMHGTSSVTAYDADQSAATLAWINWYSVNHQISLPIYMLGASLLLRLIANHDRVDLRHRWILAFGAVVSFFLVALTHAAELPYFLFMAIISLIVFRSKNISALLLIMLFSVAIGVAGIVIVTKMGYAKSPLAENVIAGNWREITALLQTNGMLLLNGANRSATSWNGIYSLSVILSCFTVLMAGASLKDHTLRKVATWVGLSALMPAMLYQIYGAGLLALITYPYLAWRFSFASFLFVAPALFLVMLHLQLKNKKIEWIVGAMLFGACLWYLHSKDAFAQVFKNVQSIRSSTDPEIMRFGVGEIRLSELQRLKGVADADGGSEAECFDLFSSYYLHYYLNVKYICLPEPVLLSPMGLVFYKNRGGVDAMRARCDCDYANNGRSKKMNKGNSLSWDKEFYPSKSP